MGWGFADKVRKMMIEMGKGNPEVAVLDIALRLDLISKKERRPVYGAISDFQQAGEVERVRPGVYRYIGKSQAVPEKRAVMWRLLRARKVVTVADFQELAGVSEVYAHEWLSMLIRRGIVKMMGADKYRLLNDPIVMPENADKAEQLRRMRERKKKAIAALNAANIAMAEAMAILADDPPPEGGTGDERIGGVSE